MCAIRKKDQEVWVLQLGKQAGLVKHVFWKNDQQRWANRRCRHAAYTPDVFSLQGSDYSAVCLSTIHTSRSSHSHCYFFFFALTYAA